MSEEAEKNTLEAVLSAYYQRDCPECDGPLELGYGLAGGGMGTYVFCQREGCSFFRKSQDEDE